VQQRHICFLDQARLKILYELAMGCIISRNHDRSRRFLIEAMDDSERSGPPIVESPLTPPNRCSSQPEAGTGPALGER
jgi:hypothetical protein